jgi:hypothetical protein
VADSAQKAAVYLVKCNPELLKSSGISLEDWQSRHQTVLDELNDDSEGSAG